MIIQHECIEYPATNVTDHSSQMMVILQNVFLQDCVSRKYTANH